MSVIIETSLGDFTIDLYTDERPKCCKNFLKLCKVKYYNFCLFHSVQRNFIAQTGDPTGTGKGGESIHGVLYGDQARYFDWEFVPKIKHVKTGLVSMVNNGNNMHGSQFFITLGDSLDYLDGVHTVFGEVTEGLEVITKLNEAYCDETYRPFRDIRIHHTIILDDPFEDPPGLEVPDRSPSPTPEVIERARLAADAEIDDLEGKTEEEIKEIMEEREEKANAQLLEMIGHLPSSDVKAPENVLFVCKLNSVTTDEDLEIIFSRFGPIRSCEVIRDYKTGESLQYAFIEFEKKEDCESAFFKMDNVLIDDRRIHVDFSQSVAKLKWKGKGKGVETMKEEPKKPKYIIKDKSQRQDNDYELIFEENNHSKSSKKKHRDKSDDAEVNHSHKKKPQYRSRSRSADRRRHRSQEKERRDYRERRDMYHREEKRRYSPPRYHNERRLSPPRHRDDRYSSSGYKDYKRDSPPRYRDNRHITYPRHRGSPQKEFRNRGREADPRRSSERRNKDLSEKFKTNHERKKNKDQKYDSSDEDELLDRHKVKKTKKYADSSDDESLDRQKRRKKERNCDSSDDESLDRQKKKMTKHSEGSDDESYRNKRKDKNKYASSSDEDEKIKRKKKKKKQDISDENEKVHKRKKKKQLELSNEEDKKKKKKKKKHDSSSDEDETARYKHGKKKRQSDSGERNVQNSDSDSPVHKKSNKHGSDKHRSHSSKESRKHSNSENSYRKHEREGHKVKHR